MVSKKKITDLVFDMANPIIEEMGLELVCVEYVKEGANWYLRLYIDKEGGVDLDDCQGVSVKISDLLDEKDPISQSYYLEVSSPGIERVLQREKDFVKYKGELVNVSLYVPIDGKKNYIGKLGSVDEENLTLIIDNAKEMKIDREQITQVRIAWKE